MPAPFLYLTKVSICLSVLYLFYRLALQQLTFADFIGMVPGKKRGANDGSFINSMPLPSQQQGTYAPVAKLYEEIKQSRNEAMTLRKQMAYSQEPYRVINGHTYLVSAEGGMASVDTITNIVFVDGKKMTGQEVNEKFSRKMINTIGAMDKEVAIKKYGVNEAVMEIFFKDLPVRSAIPKSSSN